MPAEVKINKEIRTNKPAQARSAENDLDALLNSYRQKSAEPGAGEAAMVQDPIQALREQIIRDLIPCFLELVEKYCRSGVQLQMDASNLLDGGRELKFEFSLGDYRSELQGTVTTDVIAFHEVRSAPDIHGQLLAGPMLRLKQLSPKTFREFVCERLALLLKQASRRK
ncbi:MAG: hypothetical protein HY287_13720 [Planctomycetes bacterium]|nr:hypothetical protein [Planctomycetota bacterium]MBI3835381.1 hypothetical protein [Planctomycetota bacterium]